MPSKIRDIAEILGVTETSNTSNAALITAAEAGGGGGATSYDSAGALPTSGNTAGDLAFTTDKKAMYNWDGSEWDRIYSGPNETLTWDSSLAATIDMETTHGTPTNLRVSANADAEGFPVTYSYELVPSNPAQLDSAEVGGAGILDSGNGSFWVYPSARDSDAGEFTFRAKATDGTHVITSTSTVKLQFSKAVRFDATVNASVAGTFPQEDTLQCTIAGNTLGGTTNVTNPLSDIMPTGKRYFEWIASGSDDWGMGLSNGVRGASTGNTVGFYWTGSSQGHSGPALGTISGARIMMAYDTSTRQVWYGVNGSWASGMDPASAGITLTSLSNGGFYFWAGSGSSSGATCNVAFYRGSNLSYSIPSGFKTI